MSSLISLVDRLSVVDVAVLSDAELAATVRDVSKSGDALAALLIRLTREVDRRQSHTADGFLSVARFLAETCELANSTAREKVRVARRLETMPETARRFHAGDLPYSKLRLLAQAADAHAATFADHETMLLDAVASLTVKDTRRVIDYWRSHCEGPGHLADLVDRAHVHVGRTIDGAVVGNFVLDPEAGAVVTTALDTAMAEMGDARASAGQGKHHRRADALHHIAKSFLEHGTVTIGGEKPHVMVIVDWATLTGGYGHSADLDRYGVIHTETIRRLACDASVSRVVMGPDSQPLDVGRSSRVFTSAQRRAVITRDRHCAFPGCDRPPPWCDLHHIQHWADGGPTSVDNAMLLCRRHHTLHHEAGFGITRHDGRLTFTRPDGTTIQTR